VPTELWWGNALEVIFFENQNGDEGIIILKWILMSTFYGYGC
jgi:hypothetical protein